MITITGDYDIHKPGEYPLLLTVTYGGITRELEVVLEVENALPVLNVNNELLKVSDTDKLDDLLARFGVTASEIFDGDLTGKIHIDTSAIMRKGGKLVPGAYPVVFTVMDEEGTEVSETATLEVESSEVEEPTDDPTDDPTEDPTDDPVDEPVDEPTGEEEDLDVEKDVLPMALASTGSEIAAVSVVLGLLLIALFIIKGSVKRRI